MEYQWTTDLESPVYKESLAIRKVVFMDEQKVPYELEIDELEDVSHHVVGYIDNTPTATARIYEKYPAAYKIQRVAVLTERRKTGLGKQLMNEIERYATELGAEKLILDAQDYAIPFYEKLGYVVEGEGFMDAGIPHHSMTKFI